VQRMYCPTYEPAASLCDADRISLETEDKSVNVSFIDVSFRYQPDGKRAEYIVMFYVRNSIHQFSNALQARIFCKGCRLR
jgi:hypothetical protein